MGDITEASSILIWIQEIELGKMVLIQDRLSFNVLMNRIYSTYLCLLIVTEVILNILWISGDSAQALETITPI